MKFDLMCDENRFEVNEVNTSMQYKRLSVINATDTYTNNMYRTLESPHPT